MTATTAATAARACAAWTLPGSAALRPSGLPQPSRPAWQVPRRRWPVLLGLLLLVLLVHAVLAGRWHREPPPLLRVLRIESRWLPAPAQAPAPRPGLDRTAVSMAAGAEHPAPSARPGGRPQASPPPVAAGDERSGLPASSEATPAPAAAAEAWPTALAGAESDTDAEPPPQALAQAPPLYDTRLPAPAVLRFEVRRGDARGEARLLWRHDGQRYLLAFDARLGGAPAWQQRSLGSLDVHGLAPDHFSDRRRQRALRAARFDREAGRVWFVRPAGRLPPMQDLPAAEHSTEPLSPGAAPDRPLPPGGSADRPLRPGEGRLDRPAVLPVHGGADPRPAVPTWPGAQDRLGWLVQLSAIVAAAREPPPELTLFVVGARGGAGPWHFRRFDDPGVSSAAGPAIHYRRDPERRDDQRVEVWLDAVDLWPLRVRLTPLPGGAPWELLRAGEVSTATPPPPPLRP